METSLVKVYWLCRILLFIVAPAIAAQASPLPLFDDDSVIDIKLSGPLRTLIKKTDDRTELPFILAANGVEHHIKVRTRGKSRRRVCDFPPLRLNFSSDDTEQTVFAQQDKLKLVTHCRKSKAGQADALQEYAAYRIYNLISDVSHRVRLIRITYIDTDEPIADHALERYGFVIEAPGQLAQRVGGKLAHVTGVTLGSLDAEHMATVYLFQYLIGNTDWSLVTANEDDVCCHNGKIVDIESKRFYVPYDFDLAGLVNARYAKPEPSLRIRNVTQRLYRGFCMQRDALRTGLNRFKMHEAEILRVTRELPGLSRRDKKSSASYLARFFSQAADEDKLLRSFEKRCL